jgi:hypothetical protein
MDVLGGMSVFNKALESCLNFQFKKRTEINQTLPTQLSLPFALFWQNASQKKANQKTKNYNCLTLNCNRSKNKKLHLNSKLQTKTFHLLANAKSYLKHFLWMIGFDSFNKI